jgi:hypothetical protein
LVKQQGGAKIRSASPSFFASARRPLTYLNYFLMV